MSFAVRAAMRCVALVAHGYVRLEMERGGDSKGHLHCVSMTVRSNSISF